MNAATLSVAASAAPTAPATSTAAAPAAPVLDAETQARMKALADAMARAQRLRTLRVQPQRGAAFTQTLQLAPQAKPSADAAARREKWLGH